MPEQRSRASHTSRCVFSDYWVCGLSRQRTQLGPLAPSCAASAFHVSLSCRFWQVFPHMKHTSSCSSLSRSPVVLSLPQRVKCAHPLSRLTPSRLLPALLRPLRGPVPASGSPLPLLTVSEYCPPHHTASLATHVCVLNGQAPDMYKTDAQLRLF